MSTTVETSKSGSLGEARKKGAPEVTFNFAVFLLFSAMWVAFAVALTTNRGSLDEVWSNFRELPLIGQGLLGLLFLPVLAGLWIWETSWPYLIRLVLVTGLAWWNIFIFW